MHYSGVRVSLCMMLIIPKNIMIIKKLMHTLQVPTPILRSMYGQVKQLSASALRFKRKFVVRLRRIKRFANIWKRVMVDTVKHDETGSSFISFGDNFDCVVKWSTTTGLHRTLSRHIQGVKVKLARASCIDEILGIQSYDFGDKLT